VIETDQPYRMPQPEQWLSEHPLVAVLVALLLLAWALHGLFA
jgi:hypothetical protein